MGFTGFTKLTKPMKRVTEYKYLKKILIRQKKIELVCRKTSYVLIDFSVSTFSLAIIANLFSYLICYKYIHLKTQNNFSTIFSPICFFYEIRTAVLGNVKCHIFLRK